MRKLALLLALTGCPTRAPSPSGADGSADAMARGFDAAASADAGTSADPGGPRGTLADAGASTTTYASKEGRFTVSAPSGVTPSETISGTAWAVAGASLAVTYYDGRPHGVDRSQLYDMARDHIGGSELEKEQDVKVGGFLSRMRRMRIVQVGKSVFWRRSAIVVVGDRTYDVSCTSPAPADLDAPLAEALFTSFHAEAPKAGAPR